MLCAQQASTLRIGRRAALLGAACGASCQGSPGPALAKAELSMYDPAAAVTAASAGRQYFPPLTPPLRDRATYRYDLGRNSWALEQRKRSP